jgi:hypothetical protein
MRISRTLPALLAVVAVTFAACGDDDGATTDEDAAADTADTVCTLLREWNNDLADIINATSRTITDADDPDTANEELLHGWADLVAAAEAHVAQAEELELPDTASRDRLVDDLTEGAEEAVALLEDEREELEALPPITVDAQPGVLGGAFVTLENVGSKVEPAIGNYDDEAIRAAFQADPGCEHVIQPF